jgi:hypothetical protein
MSGCEHGREPTYRCSVCDGLFLCEDCPDRCEECEPAAWRGSLYREEINDTKRWPAKPQPAKPPRKR